ncbi:hypothetical protein [Rhodococcus sp. HNM0569]|nr:hypothetical protein [Rhodococcus sp. HNM0569]
MRVEEQPQHGSRKELAVFGLLATMMLITVVLLLVPGIFSN